MKMGLMIHSIILLVGAVLLMLSVKMFLSAKKLKDEGIQTYAIVRENIQFESRDRSGTSIMYAPLLEYNVDGEIKTYVPNARSNPPAYNEGEKVLIVYSVKNSRDVRIVSFWGIYLASNILLILGLPMVVIGIGYFLFRYSII